MFSTAPPANYIEGKKNVVLALEIGTSHTYCVMYEVLPKDLMKLKTSKKFSHEMVKNDKSGWASHVVEEIDEAVIQSFVDVTYGCDPEQYNVLTIGLVNMRETIVAWNGISGMLLHPETISWNDQRTKALVKEKQAKLSESDQEYLRTTTGLQLSTYYSAPKMEWMMRNVENVKTAAEYGDLRFGTIDSYINYKLTNMKSFCTDVTNASRTLLCDIKTQTWDPKLCKMFGVPESSLPMVKASCSMFGMIPHDIRNYNRDPRYLKMPDLVKGVKINAMIGDQPAALFGHGLLQPGQVKMTFASGGFLLMNAGQGSKHLKAIPKGCTMSPFFQMDGHDPWFALEGSIADAGQGITWLKKNGIVELHEIDTLAASCKTSAGCMFVPAFSNGLLSPFWIPDMKGAIVGLSSKTERKHIIRAFFEALAIQMNEILKAFDDAGYLRLPPHDQVFLDGGLASSDVFMRILCDFTGENLIRPHDTNMVCYGVALCALIGASPDPKARFDYFQKTTANRSIDDLDMTSTIIKPTEKKHYLKYIKITNETWVTLATSLSRVCCSNIRARQLAAIDAHVEMEGEDFGCER